MIDTQIPQAEKPSTGPVPVLISNDLASVSVANEPPRPNLGRHRSAPPRSASTHLAHYASVSDLHRLSPLERFQASLLIVAYALVGAFAVWGLFIPEAVSG